MSTWNALYLHGALPDRFAPPLEGAMPVRKVGPWTQLALPGVESGEAAAQALSAVVPGEVVWIIIQTTASCLGVHHFENGQRVRVVEFADGTWTRVEGAPRAWEATLFSAERLEEALEGGDDPEVRAAWERRTLTTGDGQPWPREYDSMFHALGMTGETWSEAQKSPVLREVKGAGVSRVTLWARLLLGLGIAAAVGAVAVGRGELRGVLGMVATLLFIGAVAAGALRRVALGRWLF